MNEKIFGFGIAMGATRLLLEIYCSNSLFNCEELKAVADFGLEITKINLTFRKGLLKRGFITQMSVNSRILLLKNVSKCLTSMRKICGKRFPGVTGRRNLQKEEP